MLVTKNGLSDVFLYHLFDIRLIQFYKTYFIIKIIISVYNIYNYMILLITYVIYIYLPIKQNVYTYKNVPHTIVFIHFQLLINLNEVTHYPFIYTK